MEDIHATLLEFLHAFSKLRLGEMMGFFSDNATAFFPIRHHPLRLVGKEAISGAFARVIDRVRASGATQIRLDAVDVRVEAFDDVAVVTFHIRDEDLCRRTLVLQRTPEGWRIEHLHASNAPLPTKPTEVDA
jgi:ketosteroid isomerase-like protein